MKIAFYTLGCKVNQYESNWLGEIMKPFGYEVVECSDDADVYVINSCTVTAESDRKTRQAVRRFKRNHPDSIVVLTGCMTQAFPEKGIDLIQADIVMGNKNNQKLPQFIEEYLNTKERLIKIEEHKSGDGFVPCEISDFEARTRAYIKIEDGCNRFCSYCAIPYARGRVRSKELSQLSDELDSLKERGFCEVVLVGINLSAYGTDIGKTICDAVRLASEKGFERIRLGSLEPDHITDEIIEELAKIKNFCPQFHISLQSGCNRTLKNMNRHYTAEEYYHLCCKLREYFDDASLTTDIMVGFSYETDEDFEESVSFAEKIGFEKVHVFPYSVRKGTRAEKFPQVDSVIKEKRTHEMIIRTEKIRRDFLKNQIGRTVSVLFETRNKDGFTEGYTMNYTPVKVKGNVPCGKICDIKITDVDGDFCIGNII